MSEQGILSSSKEESYRSRRPIRNSPIFVKEMRGLIRQQRSRSVLTIYMVGLTVLTLLLYVTIISANAFNPDPDVRRTLGKILFLSITLMQLAVIIFIAPLFSADSITTERENKTFDLLRITSVSESSIVRGKLLAGVLFTLLLLLISLPLQSSAFLLGGITSLEFLLTILILVTTTIFLCSVSIYATSQTKQTSSAIGLAYTIAGAVLLGFPILAYVMIKITPFPSDQAVFDVLNTISKSLAPIPQIILVIVVWLLISTNPISTAFVSYNLFLDEGVRVLYDPKAFQIRIPFLAPWITFIILYLLVSWLFYRASVRRIKRSNKL
jgi:ABC-type transport system involved in multi-copper enzyme maturation permease subunit